MAEISKKNFHQHCHNFNNFGVKFPGKMLHKMGERNKEIRAVGAWAQPEPASDPSEYYAAVVSAQEEEARVQNVIYKKEERLKQFQADVKQRVRVLEQNKRKIQLERTFKCVENERAIVQQTIKAAEAGIPRMDRCTIRSKSELTIHTTSPAVKTIPSTTSATATCVDDQLDAQKKQVHRHMSRARKSLISRKIASAGPHGDELPGGVWQTSMTREHPAQRQSKELPENVTTSEADEVDDERHVQFEPPKCPEQKKTARGSVLQDLQNVTIPEIHPGILGEELKKQTSTQRALYRRLFMDIEREQVKEMKKKNEHRKKIAILKKEKETERERLENEALSTLEPKDAVTGETLKEVYHREKIEKKEIDDTINKFNKKAKKQRENERFLEALKNNLKEKAENKNLQIPPLCSCCDDIWDMNTDNCANNCIFYKNPKAYAKALQSLVAHCDL